MSGLKITFKKFFLSSCEVSSSHLLQSDKMWVYHHRVFSTRAGRVFHCHLPIGMQIWRRVGRARDVSQHISRSWTCKGAFDIWELMKSIWNLYIYMTFIYTYTYYIDMRLLLLSALAPPFSQICCWFPFFLSINKTILQLQPPQLPTNQPSQTFNDFVPSGQWPQMGEGSLGRCQFVHAPRGSLRWSTLWQLDGCWSRAGVGIHEGGRMPDCLTFLTFSLGRNKNVCVFLLASLFCWGRGRRMFWRNGWEVG